jgi:hypothetical protein
MVEEYLLTLEVKSMKANGNTIKLRDMECMFIQITLDMRVNGFKTCNMGKVLKNGKMVQFS